MQKIDNSPVLKSKLPISIILESHPVIKVLKDQPLKFKEIRDLLSSANGKYILFLPTQDACESEQFTLSFFENHVFVKNPENESQLISLKGLRGLLTNDHLIIVGPTPSEEELISLWDLNEEKTIQKEEKNVSKSLWDTYKDDNLLLQLFSPTIDFPQIPIHLNIPTKFLLDKNNNEEVYIEVILIKRMISDEDQEKINFQYSDPLINNKSSSSEPASKAVKSLLNAYNHKTNDTKIIKPASPLSPNPVNLFNYIPNIFSAANQPAKKNLSHSNSKSDVTSNVPTTLLPKVAPTTTTAPRLSSNISSLDVKLNFIEDLKDDENYNKFYSKFKNDSNLSFLLPQINDFIQKINEENYLKSTNSNLDKIGLESIEYKESENLKNFFESIKIKIKSINSKNNVFNKNVNKPNLSSDISTMEIEETLLQDVIDGLESFVLYSVYQSTFTNILRNTEKQDLNFQHKISCLNVLDIDFEYLISTENKNETSSSHSRVSSPDLSEKEVVDHRILKDILKSGGLEILKVENFFTPKKKIDTIVNFHQEILKRSGNIFKGKPTNKKSELKTKEVESSDDPLNLTKTKKTIYVNTVEKNENTGGNSADFLLPLLIYIIIRTNPPRFISNLTYITKFLQPKLCDGYRSYCLTNLLAVTSYIESTDFSTFDFPLELMKGPTIHQYNNTYLNLQQSLISSPTSIEEAGGNVLKGLGVIGSNIFGYIPSFRKNSVSEDVNGVPPPIPKRRSSMNKSNEDLDKTKSSRNSKVNNQTIIKEKFIEKELISFENNINLKQKATFEEENLVKKEDFIHDTKK
ncbi:hypothetical protein HK099_001000 [Clydaea vesicula]|uniref:VPS9 domain-containing protein n=1 Tax=Clydaea vesicula TaxID=447962 RepID=A0AAD5TUG2_9FUNG|nr:hypothetical protein HK099_001000 [Clydaea vesicula]